MTNIKQKIKGWIKRAKQFRQSVYLDLYLLNNLEKRGIKPVLDLNSFDDGRIKQ